MRRSRALQRQTTTTFSFCSGAPMNAPHSTLCQVIKWPRRFAKTITGGWQPRGVRADNTKIIPSANFETLLVRTWSVGTCSGLNSPNPSPRLTVLRRVNLVPRRFHWVDLHDRLFLRSSEFAWLLHSAAPAPGCSARSQLRLRSRYASFLTALSSPNGTEDRTEAQKVALTARDVPEPTG